MDHRTAAQREFARKGLKFIAELPSFNTITYRIINYWITHDVIRIALNVEGSGSRRGFSDLDVDRLVFIDNVIHEVLWPWATPDETRSPSPNPIPSGLIRNIWQALDCDPWPDRLRLSSSPKPQDQWVGWTEIPVPPRASLQQELIGQP